MIFDLLQAKPFLDIVTEHVLDQIHGGPRMRGAFRSLLQKCVDAYMGSDSTGVAKRKDSNLQEWSEHLHRQAKALKRYGSSRVEVNNTTGGNYILI